MYKQVIVVNKSLNMSPGKLGAMVAHGATSFFCEWFKRNVVTSNETYNDYLITPNARVDKELFAQWISGSFTKIVLEVEDDAAMKAIIEKAHEYGMVNRQDFFNIVDESTEFLDIPQWAVIAFKPMEMDIIKTSYEKQQESMVESKSPGEKYIWVEGFKGTQENMCCTVTYPKMCGFSVNHERKTEQYELNVPKILEGDPAVGRNGFHFCKDLDDVFRYYPFDFHNRFFKVKALVKKEEYDNRLFAALAAKEIILYEEVFPEYEEVKQYLKCTSKRYHEPYQFTEEDFNGAKEMGKEVYFKNKFIGALVKLGHSHLLSELVVEQCSCDVAYMKHIIDVATALKDEGVSRDTTAYILLGGIHEVK